MCAGTPPPSAHSAGGEMTLPPAPNSEQPPAAQRSCNGAESIWLWESRSFQAPLPHFPPHTVLWPAQSRPHPMAAASCVEPALLPSAAPFSMSGPMTAPHRTDPSLQAAARNFQGVGSCLVLVPGTTDRDMYLQQRQHSPTPLWPRGNGWPRRAALSLSIIKSPLRPTGHCTPGITHEATLALSASAEAAAAQSRYSSGGLHSSHHPPTL